MADDSSFTIQLTISDSPSTVASKGSHTSENSIMTRSRSRAAAQQQQHRPQQESMQHQPMPPLQNPAPALTQRTDNTSAPQNLNTAIESANEAPVPQPISDIANLMTENGLNALSLNIRNNNTGGMMLDEQMKQLTTISKKYKNAKDSTWRSFLKIVVEHCGSQIATLASTTITLPDGSETNALVRAVQGEQSAAKKNILNYCLTAFVRYNRLKQKSGHKLKGDHYEPAVMVNQIKAIAQEFNCVSSRNMTGTCKYQFFKDFKGPGEYTSILQNIWYNEMVKDPHFGKKPFAARFDPLAYEKVQEAIRSGELDMDDPHDLLLLTIFAQGYCLWLRGCEEQHDRKWSEYTFSKLSNGVDKATIDLSSDKTYKPWTVENLVKSRENLSIVETAEDDPFKPVAVLKKMKKIAEENNIDYVLIDQSKSGEFQKVTKNNMPNLLDELAGRCQWGVKTTGHSLRKGGITKAAKKAATMAQQKMVSGHARHASTAITQAIYNQPSDAHKDDFALIRAGHRPSPPASNENEKVEANNNLELSQMTYADQQTVHSNNGNFQSFSNYFDAQDDFPGEISLVQPPPATETILQKKIDDLETENVRLKNKISDLTSSNTHMICDYQILQVNNQSLRNENEELKKKLKETNVRYEKVEGKLERRTSKLYSKEAELDNVSRELEDANRRKRKLKEKVEVERMKRKKAEKELGKNPGCVVM